MYSRAQILLTGESSVIEFVTLLNQSMPTDKFVLEDESGLLRVNPRSVMGILYALADFKDKMYLVNLTNNGVYPVGFDKFRTY